MLAPGLGYQAPSVASPNYGPKEPAGCGMLRLPTAVDLWE